MINPEVDEDEQFFNDIEIDVDADHRLGSEKLDARFKIIFDNFKSIPQKSKTPTSEIYAIMLSHYKEDGVDTSELEKKYHAQQKLELATEVWHTDKIPKTLKKRIYLALTNEPPPLSSRGAPATTGRDMLLSFEYLYRQDMGEEIKTIKSDLRVKHKMVGEQDATFYAALQRGMKELRISASRYAGNNKMRSEKPKKYSVPVETDVRFTICFIFGDKLILKLLDRFEK